MKSHEIRERDRLAANPAGITRQARAIGATFGAQVSPAARAEFVSQARRAVEEWLDLSPIGKPFKRQHRSPSAKSRPWSAHRPGNPLRHSLIAELYDAWMAAKGSEDPDAVRGFKRTADTVLAAANLPAVSERETRHLHEQIAAFGKLAARLLD